MRVAIQTLGCKVNQSESAAIEADLRKSGFTVVKSSDCPDVVIVNSCTVTAKSDAQSRQCIRKAVRSGAQVIATGCYAQLRHDEISQISGVSLILGNAAKCEMPKYLHSLSSGGSSPKIEISACDKALTAQSYFSSRSRAFLKIQDGCNFSCNYCTVPKARGRSRSMAEKDIFAAVKDINQQGYKEIILTGIHIGAYGSDLIPQRSLLEIIERMSFDYPEVRIRMSSVEPREFRDEYLQLMREGRLCPHLHIPLQSGSDRVLTAMGRGYTADYYEQLINRIVTGYPGLNIGTDVIVGFPGETDKEFDKTVNFIKRIPLNYLHVFPYSNRPGTIASTMIDQVAEPVKKERVKLLVDIGNKHKRDFYSKSIGCILNVIVEQYDETAGHYNAISDNYIRVHVKSKELRPGSRINVRVTSLTGAAVSAEPLKSINI